LAIKPDDNIPDMPKSLYPFLNKERFETVMKDMTGEINRLSVALDEKTREWAMAVKALGEERERALKYKAQAENTPEDLVETINELCSIDWEDLLAILEQFEGKASDVTKTVSHVIGVVRRAIDLGEKYSPICSKEEDGSEENSPSERAATQNGAFESARREFEEACLGDIPVDDGPPDTMDMARTLIVTNGIPTNQYEVVPPISSSEIKEILVAFNPAFQSSTSFLYASVADMLHQMLHSIIVTENNIEKALVALFKFFQHTWSDNGMASVAQNIYQKIEESAATLEETCLDYIPTEKSTPQYAQKAIAQGKLELTGKVLDKSPVNRSDLTLVLLTHDPGSVIMEIACQMDEYDSEAEILEYILRRIKLTESNIGDAVEAVFQVMFENDYDEEAMGYAINSVITLVEDSDNLVKEEEAKDDDTLLTILETLGLDRKLLDGGLTAENFLTESEIRRVFLTVDPEDYYRKSGESTEFDSEVIPMAGMLNSLFIGGDAIGIEDIREKVAWMISKVGKHRISDAGVTALTEEIWSLIKKKAGFPGIASAIEFGLPGTMKVRLV